MKLLDLCCGKKGASKEFEKAGWDIVTVDINPKFNPTIIADINNLHLESPGEYDLIWASPVCTDYSKAHLPISWKCNGGVRTVPDMRLFLNCYRIIRYLKPRWWVIENVLGAKPYFSLVLGEYSKHVGSRYLWGNSRYSIPHTNMANGDYLQHPTEQRSDPRSQPGLQKHYAWHVRNKK